MLPTIAWQTAGPQIASTRLITGTPAARAASTSAGFCWIDSDRGWEQAASLWCCARQSGTTTSIEGVSWSQTTEVPLAESSVRAEDSPSTHAVRRLVADSAWVWPTPVAEETIDQVRVGSV